MKSESWRWKQWRGRQVRGRTDGVMEIHVAIPPLLAGQLLLVLETGILASPEFPLAHAAAGELRTCLDHLLKGHKVREFPVDADIVIPAGGFSALDEPTVESLPVRPAGESILHNTPAPRLARILENQATDEIVHDLAHGQGSYHVGSSPMREYPAVQPNRRPRPRHRVGMDGSDGEITIFLDGAMPGSADDPHGRFGTRRGVVFGTPEETGRGGMLA